MSPRAYTGNGQRWPLCPSMSKRGHAPLRRVRTGSLPTEVSVAGKRNFQGRDKEAETALEIQGCRCRDKISPGDSANSRLIAGFREISVADEGIAVSSPARRSRLGSPRSQLLGQSS